LAIGAIIVQTRAGTFAGEAYNLENPLRWDNTDFIELPFIVAGKARSYWHKHYF
jgi:hypothetical protein